MIPHPDHHTKYPFDAWKLSSSYKVSTVLIVRAHGYSYYKTDAAACYCAEELYETRELAIEDGFNKLGAAQARVVKQQVNIKQRAATLRQQAGET